MRKLRIIGRILMLSGIALLIILILAQTIPMIANDAQRLNNASQQRTRSQIILNAALTIAYRDHDSEEYAQAVSNLQNVLSEFERAQNGLRNGDRGLGFSSNPGEAVITALNTANPGYIAIKTAAQILLDSRDEPVDIVQVDIIVNNERVYRLAMTQAISHLQQDAEARNQFIFWINFVLIILLVAEAIWLLIIEQKKCQLLLAQQAAKEVKTNEARR